MVKLSKKGRPIKETPEWVRDKAIQHWTKTNLGKTSAKSYIGRIQKWMDFIQMTPTEQIEKRIKDLQSNNLKVRNFFENKVIEYKNRLETQSYKSATIHNMLVPIQSFFSAHRVTLNFRRGELTPKASKKEKIIKKFVPSNEEIRAMYSVADVRERALLLVLYQSGFSPVDTLALNIQDIENLYDLPDDRHYFIEMHRQKTNSIVATCISYEAIYEIKAMLKTRGNPKKGALFVSKVPKNNEENRLSQKYLSIALKDVAEKALAPQRASKFITKSLRDAYNCALLQANLTQEVKDLLFGHKRKGAKEHYAYNEIIVRQAYQKAFKYLSINGHNTAKKAIAELETKLDNTVEVMTNKISNQKDEIHDLKKTITDLRFTMQPYIEEMSKIQKLRKMIEKDKKQNTED